MTDDYTPCGAVHRPTGLTCVLRRGHTQANPQHLTLDNDRDWGGSPGLPIRWLFDTSPTDISSDVVGLLEHGPSPQEKGYTGDVCTNCGGSNMMQSGTCATCMDCGTTGGCS